MIREVVFLVPDGPAVERPDDEHSRDTGEEIPARSLQVIHQGFEDGEAEQIRPFAAKEIDHKALLTEFFDCRYRRSLHPSVPAKKPHRVSVGLFADYSFIGSTSVSAAYSAG